MGERRLRTGGVADADLGEARPGTGGGGEELGAAVLKKPALGVRRRSAPGPWKTGGDRIWRWPAMEVPMGRGEGSWPALVGGMGREKLGASWGPRHGVAKGGAGLEGGARGDGELQGGGGATAARTRGGRL